MEITLRRLDGVDKVAISIEKQLFAVTYKGDVKFQPEALRKAVAAADVEAVRFHVEARGRVEKQGEERFLVAGPDRFLVVDSAEVPVDVLLGFLGTVNDSASPMQIKIDDFKHLEPDGRSD
jgi:sarcosine oxidase gamma subunit